MNTASLKNDKGNTFLSTMVITFFLFFSLTLISADYFRSQTFYIHSVVYYQSKVMRELAKQEILYHYQKPEFPSEGTYYFDQGDVLFKIKKKGEDKKTVLELKVRLKNHSVFGEIEEIELEVGKNGRNS